jgi:hypothetical protein
VRRADNLTTFMCRLSRNLGASTSWNPVGLSRPVMGLLYLTFVLVVKHVFPDTLNIFPYIWVKDQILCAYKTAGKIIILLILVLLNSVQVRCEEIF